MDRAMEHHRDGDAQIEVDDEGEEELPPDAPLKFRFSWRKLWRFVGPGWLMSLAYLDPGNLESSLQMGAYTHFSLLWVLWWATVVGLLLQEMSARLGLVTGNDLAQTVRAEYPRWVTYVVYVMMEIAVIGADIQEVVGTAVAIQLATNPSGRKDENGNAYGIPVWAGCLITGLDTFTFLAVQYLGVRYLEALIFVLIGTMSVCFFINWGGSNADPGELFTGWMLPSMPAYALTQTVGTIGAVIMPHNLYLHSGLVLSRNVKRSSPHKVHAAIWYARIEAAGALFFAFMINLAIVATNSATFFSSSCANLTGGPYACMSNASFILSGDNMHTDVGGQGSACALGEGGGGTSAVGDLDGLCGEIGLASEGYALSSALGPSSLFIWALGLFAAGQASTMVCTYAGQIIMGGCLQVQLAPWKRVAFTRLFALGPAMAVAIGTGSDTSLFNNINEYLNVLQSVQLPFAMLPVLHFAASRDIMGRFKSSALLFTVSCIAALGIMAINVFLVIQFIQDQDAPVGVILIVILCAIGYFGVCFRLMWSEIVAIFRFLQRVLLGRGPPAIRASGDEFRPAEGLRDGLSVVDGEDGNAVPKPQGGRI